MAMFLYSIAAVCIVVNLVLAHTMNLGIQDQLPVAGYVGMALSVMFTMCPIFFVLAAREVQYWDKQR
tara:strand:- start:165 stop:365 length:201 start_codon:yes stop_codon:yes gene_type:complete